MISAPRQHSAAPIAEGPPEKQQMTAEKKEITKMTWVHLMGFNEVICIYLSLYNEI